MSDEMTLRNINEMKRLMANVRGDITATGQRAKDMTDFVTKIGVYTSVNPLTSTKHLDQTNKVVSGITEAYDAGFKGVGIGGHRAVYREISQKYTMGYVTRMGDDMKDQLRGILAKNLDKGLGWQETAKEMSDNVDGMTRKRAVMIARTESVRAKNLGQWAEHKEMGYKYFEVLPHSTACKRCKQHYTGVVFPMTGKFAVMLPPLHPNCRCAARFYKEVPAGYKVVRQVPKQYQPGPKPKPQPQPTPPPISKPEPQPKKMGDYGKAYTETQGVKLTSEDNGWLNAKNLNEFGLQVGKTDSQVHAVLDRNGLPLYVTKSPPTHLDNYKLAMQKVQYYRDRGPITEIHSVHPQISKSKDITDTIQRWLYESPQLKHNGMKGNDIKNSQKMILADKKCFYEIQPRAENKMRSWMNNHRDNPDFDLIQLITNKKMEYKLDIIDRLPGNKRAQLIKKIGGEENLDEYLFTKAMESVSKDLGIWFRRYDAMDLKGKPQLADILTHTVNPSRMPKLPDRPPLDPKTEFDRSWYPSTWSKAQKQTATEEYKKYPKDLRDAAEKNKMSLYDGVRTDNVKGGIQDCWIFRDPVAETEIILPKSFYKKDLIGGTYTNKHDLNDILKWYKEAEISTRKATKQVFLHDTAKSGVLADATYSTSEVRIFMKHHEMWKNRPGTDKSFSQVVKHEMGHCLDYRVTDRELTFIERFELKAHQYWSSKENELYFKAMKRDDAHLKNKYVGTIRTEWGRYLRINARDRRERYVTDYGESAARSRHGLTEDFAEAVSFKQLYPKEFKKLFPNRDAVLDELFRAYG